MCGSRRIPRWGENLQNLSWIRAGKGIYNYKTGFFYAAIQAEHLSVPPSDNPTSLQLIFSIFGRLYKKKNWKFRQLYWLRYAYGDDPLLRNRLSISTLQLIRGFNANNVFVEISDLH